MTQLPLYCTTLPLRNVHCMMCLKNYSALHCLFDLCYR